MTTTEQNTAAAEDAQQEHQEDAPATDADQQEHQEADEGEEKSKPAREAAKYRRQLRDTEAERDELRDQLTTARREIVAESIRRSGSGVDPALVWELGHTPDELMGSDGTVDQQAVKTLTGTLAERFGLNSSVDPVQAAAANPAPPEKETPQLFRNS